MFVYLIFTFLKINLRPTSSPVQYTYLIEFYYPTLPAYPLCDKLKVNLPLVSQSIGNIVSQSITPISPWARTQLLRSLQ